MSRVEFWVKFNKRAGWNKRAGRIFFRNMINEQGRNVSNQRADYLLRNENYECPSISIINQPKCPEGIALSLDFYNPDALSMTPFS